MTTVNYLGDTVDQVYNSASFAWLDSEEQKNAINTTVDILGVSAAALIGDAIVYLSSATNSAVGASGRVIIDQ